MQIIPLPKKIEYISGEDKDSGKFIIEGCYPGYGTTLGNALRRVLLSSLEGAAVTSVKIKGVLHEFSVIDGVMEDVVQIILNLKKVRFKMHGDEPVKVTLKHKGEGKVLAKEIKCSSSVEVVNGKEEILTVTDPKIEIDMEITVEKGLGYVAVEQREGEEKEIGSISIDAVYTPIRRVNYEVENTRVGKRTDYNKIIMEIVTDGSITPKEAFKKATEILINQFSAIFEVGEIKEEEEKSEKEKEIKAKPISKKKVAREEKKEKPEEIEVNDLNISLRTLNVLKEHKIKKVEDIVKLSEVELRSVDGMGNKGIKEVKKAIGNFGLILKR